MGCLWSIIVLSFWVCVAAVIGLVFPPGWLLIPIVIVVWAVRTLSKTRQSQTQQIVDAINKTNNA